MLGNVQVGDGDRYDDLAHDHKDYVNIDMMMIAMITIFLINVFHWSFLPSACQCCEERTNLAGDENCALWESTGQEFLLHQSGFESFYHDHDHDDDDDDGDDDGDDHDGDDHDHHHDLQVL